MLDPSLSQAKRKLILTKRALNDSIPAKPSESFLPDANTERKGSLESLASFQSYESQVSVESSESHHSQENSNSKPVPSTRMRRNDQSSTSVGSSLINTTSRLSSVSRRTDSSSTGYSDGEFDSESPSVVHSAPPVFNTVPSTFSTSRDVKYHHTSLNLSPSPSPNSDIWRKRPDYTSGAYNEYPLQIPQKPTITRSPNVSQHRNLTESLLEQARLERLNEASNLNVKLDSPLRREQRRLGENENVSGSTTARLVGKDTKEYNYLRRQNSEGDASLNEAKISTLKGSMIRPKEKTEPDVPVRSARRNRPPRDLQCRSMGESVTETGTSEARSIFLGTIKETDLKSSNVWTRKEDKVENSRSVTDWPVKKSETMYKVQPASVGKRRPNALTTMELRRRNSDPATKVSELSDDKTNVDTSPNDLKPVPGMNLIEWKGTHHFTLAGHRFRKIARFSKDDVCVCCREKMDAFVTQGYKCTDCKQPYHVKCIQNGGVLKMPCILANTPNRRNKRKPLRTPYETAKQAVTSKFSLTRTSAFSDSTDKIISDAKELALMQDFITKKIYIMEGQEEGKKPPSEVDRVFKQALRKFKDDLVITYSVAIQQGIEGNIKYTDLIANFLHVMQTVCKQENTREDFPVTMGVNAFRGFMNEFMALAKSEAMEKQSKSKRKKEKKRKQEEPIRHGNHMFQLTIINIPTACEVCTSFFMWPIERGLVCQSELIFVFFLKFHRLCCICTVDITFEARGKKNGIYVQI